MRLRGLGLLAALACGWPSLAAAAPPEPRSQPAETTVMQGRV
jgi:hypothetical protein